MAILVLYYNQKEGDHKTSKTKKEIDKMTKKEMINYIEKSGMVIDFSRSYFEKMLKEKVEYFYNLAVKYVANKA